MEEEIITREYFYVVPYNDPDLGDVQLSNNKSFSYFKLLDEKKEVIDMYDFINIEGTVRLDFEIVDGQCITRIYPYIGKEGLKYNLAQHLIIGDSDISLKRWGL